MQPLEFGTQKQLFIDDLVIEEALGVTRNLNQPAKYVGNPVMIPIYPWEGRLELFGTVWRDPDGTFRMWYQGMGGMGVARMGLDLTGTQLEDLNFDMRNLHYSICYATSHDGIHWVRPNLGLVEHNGAPDNNIVISNAAFANVIEDTRDPDPTGATSRCSSRIRIGKRWARSTSTRASPSPFRPTGCGGPSTPATP